MVMDGILVRIAWFAIIAAASAYITYLIFGGIFEVKEKQIISLRDEIRGGQHTLTGIVMVPTPCNQLSSDVVELTKTVFALNLRTWHDPAVQCPEKITPRNFKVVAFAPAFGVQFVVFLDGELMQFDLIPVISDNL
jgi:hypothetical protein